MSGRDFSERDIHMALDGELPEEDRTAYDAWLDANQDMKARAARYEADRQRLRASLEAVLAEPVPARLSRALEGGAAEPPRRAALRWIAAAAIFSVGGLGGYALGRRGDGPVSRDERLAQNAIIAHRIYSAEKLHVVEVGADQKDHLVGWLSRRVGLTLMAPDLSAQGYELIGGRLLPADGGTAAQFMYQSADGQRVSLYITSDKGEQDTGFRLYEGDPIRACYWVDEGYGCAVAGAAPAAKLLAAANLAYRQLLAGAEA